MKQTITLLTCILFCIPSLVNAQIDSSIIDKSNHIIEHLDKNNIPTGVLYDMVVPFGQLYIHNGQNDSAISSPVLISMFVL